MIDVRDELSIRDLNARYIDAVNRGLPAPGLIVFLEGEDVIDYIDRAGGPTDSAHYAVLTQPTGESRRVNFGLFRANPEVLEGAAIDVRKIPPPAPSGPTEPFATTVKDIFAILASAATIWIAIWTVSK